MPALSSLHGLRKLASQTAVSWCPHETRLPGRLRPPGSSPSPRVAAPPQGTPFRPGARGRPAETRASRTGRAPDPSSPCAPASSQPRQPARHRQDPTGPAAVSRGDAVSVATGGWRSREQSPGSIRVTHLSRVDSENEQEVVPAAGGVPRAAGRGRAVCVAQSCPEPPGVGTGRTRGSKAAWSLQDGVRGPDLQGSDSPLPSGASLLCP